MPGMPKAHVKLRIVLTPQIAKRLMKALHENITKYKPFYKEKKKRVIVVVVRFFYVSGITITLHGKSPCMCHVYRKH